MNSQLFSAFLIYFCISQRLLIIPISVPGIFSQREKVTTNSQCCTYLLMCPVCIHRIQLNVLYNREEKFTNLMDQFNLSTFNQQQTSLTSTSVVFNSFTCPDCDNLSVCNFSESFICNSFTLVRGDSYKRCTHVHKALMAQYICKT